MKICYLSDQYASSNSGVGTYARNLIGGVVREGHQVVLITCDSREESITRGLKVITIPKVSYHNLHPSWILKSLRFSKALKQLFRSETFDLIHFLDAREALFFSEKKCPVVGTMNDYYFAETPSLPFELRPHYRDWVKRWSYYQLVRQLEKSTIRKFEQVIACSDAVKESIRKRYCLLRDQVTTVYYGIERHEHEPDPPEKQPSIVIIGGNIQRKGFPLLLKAVGKILLEIPDLQLYVIGTNPVTKQIEADLKKTPLLYEHVHFLGQISSRQVREILRRSSLYVMPSLMEGFGISFLEAMQMGVPVIGGNVGGTRELIKDGENGFLVNPTDERDLASKIIRLLSDRELYERFRKNGFETARKYTVERMARETLTVYECVLKEKVALGS